jgi:hypothetical protein
VLLVQLRSMNIAQIDCFPAYCVERVTIAFVMTVHLSPPIQ